MLQKFYLNVFNSFGYFFQYLSIIFVFIYLQLPSFACSLFNFSYVIDLFSVGFSLLFLWFFLFCVFLSFNYFFYERIYFIEYFFLVGFFLVSVLLLVGSN